MSRDFELIEVCHTIEDGMITTKVYPRPDSGFKFFAVPVKIKHFGTFPVRAFGLVLR